MNVLKWFAYQLFKLLGWKVVGGLPPHIPKAVLIFAPHTSNWDAFYGLTALASKKVPVRFVVKKEAMFFPLGLLLRSLRAVPIDRRKKTQQAKATNMVEVMVHMFAACASLFLVISPEGTRDYAKHWKTGFYYIAVRAQVPIILGYLDYAKKEVGIGPVFYPTGAVEQDIQYIQAFYKDKIGKHPEKGVR